MNCVVFTYANNFRLCIILTNYISKGYGKSLLINKHVILLNLGYLFDSDDSIIFYQSHKKPKESTVSRPKPKKAKRRLTAQLEPEIQDEIRHNVSFVENYRMYSFSYKLESLEKLVKQILFYKILVYACSIGPSGTSIIAISALLGKIRGK